MRAPSDWPRVLLYSEQVPESSYAGSLVLLRLFAGFPPEQLLVAGPPPKEGADTLDCTYLPLRLPLQRLTRSRFAALYRAAHLYRVAPGPDGPGVTAAIRQFRPTVVVCILQSFPHYAKAARLARELDVPLVWIVHDLPETFEPVPSWARKRQRTFNRDLYGQAGHRLCVSRQMAEYLQRLYGTEGTVLYPSRDEDLVARPVEETARLKEPDRLRLGYAGSLAYGYGRAIEELLPVLEESGTVLTVFTREQPVWKDHPQVDFRGFAPSPKAAWEALQKDCDALLLPFDRQGEPNLKRLYSTHFPSKLTEYTALGMPIVVCGPTYSTGVLWARSNPEAALTAHEPGELAAHLHSLRTDGALRRKLAAGALEAGRRDFDPVVLKRTFWRALGCPEALLP